MINSFLAIIYARPHSGRVMSRLTRPSKLIAFESGQGLVEHADVIASGVGPGSEVSPMYDPMIAKLIVWDTDRASATSGMVRALGEYQIGQLKTLLPLHRAILQTQQWANAETCRDLIEDRGWLKTLAFPKTEKGSEHDPSKLEQEYTVEGCGKRFATTVIGAPPAVGFPITGGILSSSAGSLARRRAAGAISRARPSERVHASNDLTSDGTLTPPLQGTGFKIAAQSAWPSRKERCSA